jgi:hypothetical protein
MPEDKGHRVTIIRSKAGGYQKVYLDEMPLHGIKELHLRHSVHDPATLTITLLPSGIDVQEVP